MTKPEERYCKWCWWAKLNEDNRLICSNHTPDKYGKDVTENPCCYLFCNVNEL